MGPTRRQEGNPCRAPCGQRAPSAAGPDGLFLFLSLAPSSVLVDPRSHVVVTHEDRLITEGTCVKTGVSSGES